MDLYAVLGVAKTSTADEIRSAYRKLAFQLHPDRNPGDKAKESQFKDVSHAYDILSDDGRRARYDLERSRPAPAPVQAASFFRRGRGGFVFTPSPAAWGSTGTNASVQVGASVQIRIDPMTAGQAVQIQVGNVVMPGVRVFVRRA